MIGLNTIFVVVVLLLVFYGVRAVRSSMLSRENNLLKLCHGDQEQVDRLIALEQRRNSKLSRRQAARAAIYAYRRDNR